MNHHDKQAKENALSSSMGCFMKGTLVKRPEGWTPIDELKVGDLVMSRPENGIGKAVPKRVVNTFRYEDKEVVMLKFSQFPERNGGGGAGTLVVTPNHPFCVYGVVTNLILEHPKFSKLGAYWKSCDYDDGEYVFAGDEGRARYEALWAFKHTPYEMRLYEQPVWKRADQLERGDVVLGVRDYYVVDLLRKYPEDLQFPNEIRKPNPKKQQGIQNGRETEKIISIRTGMGAQHDMRLVKRHLAELYPYKIVIADKGYQGLAKTGLQTPKKKSKHHPLNKQDKEANRRLGKLRTVIEHINRKLKIFKILSLPYRNRRKRFGLRANLIAGLVNAMG